MSETPSKRRHQGREDYHPNTDPLDLCPYYDPSYIADYIDGWKEAETEEAEEKEAKSFDVYHTDEYFAEDIFLGRIESFDIDNGFLRIDDEIFIRKEY